MTDEEYYQFINYCNKRDLISLGPVTVERLRVMDSDSKIIEAEGFSYNDALDNLNIALQSHLRRKIDALCEELKELEDMEI